MSRIQKKVVIIGSGTMGRQIAAWLVPYVSQVSLLDIVTDKGESLSQKAVSELPSMKPAPLYDPNHAFKIRAGNIGENDAWITEADWIIEVVTENPKVKQIVMANIEKYWNGQAVISSNTSGIATDVVLEGRSQEFRKHFLVTHFFNPVRYMKLLEIVFGKMTDLSLVQWVIDFCQYRDKGIVYCKDTPNFTANRQGVLAMVSPLKFLSDLPLCLIDPIHEILYGWKPLDTADIVGLDLMKPVAATVLDNVKPEDDPFLAFYQPIELIEKLVKMGRLGRKTKGGFYTMDRAAGGLKLLNPITMEYELVKTDFSSYPSLAQAYELRKEDPIGALKTLLTGNDPAAELARNCFYRQVAYALMLKGVICDTFWGINRAMQWGYNWSKGIFDYFSILGKAMIFAGIEQVGCGKMIPDWARQTEVFTDEEPQPFKVVNISAAKKNVIATNPDASLLDIGDGAGLVYFHSGSLNPIGDGVLDMLNKATNWAEQEIGKRALVIGNDNPRAFSAGADLKIILKFCQDAHWSAVDDMIKKFQAATQWLTYCKIPVVGVGRGMALGGGNETLMACDYLVLSPEFYDGQVEPGVGLIAAAGGCMRVLRNHLIGIPASVLWNTDDWTNISYRFLQKVFNTLAMMEVPTATSADMAVLLGYVRPGRWEIFPSTDPGRLIQRAKEVALSLAPAYIPPEPFVFHLPGVEAATKMDLTMAFTQMGHWLPAPPPLDKHLQLIASKIAYIITGGKTRIGDEVTEQDILDLEREAFIELCKTAQTMMMIQAKI